LVAVTKIIAALPLSFLVAKQKRKSPSKDGLFRSSQQASSMQMNANY
jgi:hypothetical protein